MKIPDDPGWGFGYFVVSDNLNNLEDKIKPVMKKNIRTSDENVYAIIKIFNIEKMVRIHWIWYGPDKKIVRRSDVVHVNSGEKFLEYFVIWDSLDRTFYYQKKGQWSVAVIADDHFLASRSFTVN